MIQRFVEQLEAKKAACLLEAAALSQDSREDEGNLAKIKANVYGIAAAVCQAARGKAPEAGLAFVQEKLETIPKAWEESLVAAQAHDDHGKATIERVKLEVMGEIRRMLSDAGETRP